jgi:hypothetical protein
MHRLLILLIVLTSLVPAMTLAAPHDKPEDVEKLVARLEKAKDWRAAYAKLTPAEQDAIDRYATDGVVSEKLGPVEPMPDLQSATKDADIEAGLALQAAGCWQRAYTRKLTNWLGVQMWRFTQYIYWCGNGSWINQVPSSWINVNYSMFWQWGGIIDSNFLGGYGYNGYRAYRQGYFKYCPLQVGCLREDKPYIYQQGMADGTYYRSGGGGNGSSDG